jgi:glucose/mannose-6-phosphate isomerase
VGDVEVTRLVEAYLSWPKQALLSINEWGRYRVEGGFDEILITGMGGSGIVGDYVQVLSASKGSIPVYVNKSHLIPSFVSEKTLVIIVSYSGNTLESIRALERALKTRWKVVTVSSGGALRDISARHGLLHVQVPPGLLPRASLPAMLYAILGLLDSSGVTIVSKDEALESVAFLEKTTPSCIEIGEEIASWLFEMIRENRLFVIATHSPYDPLAIRGKNEFNENSKLVAKVDIAPEWMHNDIVGYELPVPSKFAVLEILDPADSVGVKLVEFMDKVYRLLDAQVYRLELKGSTLLERLMYGSLVLGLASVYLGVKRGVDPATTKSIAMYKSEASKIFSS